MSTFFYSRLRQGGFSAVQKWTRRIDLFAQELCIMPIHLGMHWACAVMDFKNKKVRYYDSLHGKPPGFGKAILEYLSNEHQDKKKEPLPSAEDWEVIFDGSCPAQHNGYDCGVFACVFAEHASRNAPMVFAQRDMLYYRDRISYEILTQRLLC